MVIAMSPSSNKRRKQQQPSQQQSQQEQPPLSSPSRRTQRTGSGGLLGKLLTPGYTHAGASAAFESTSSSQQRRRRRPPQPTAPAQHQDHHDTDDNLILPLNDATTATTTTNELQQQQQQQQQMIGMKSPDTFSEAATELHDNRSRSTAGRILAASSLQLSVGSLPPPPPGGGSGTSSGGRETMGQVTAAGVVSPPANLTPVTRLAVKVDKNHEAGSQRERSTNNDATQPKVSSKPLVAHEKKSPRRSPPLLDDHAARYGFFPSTKPSPSPSPVASSVMETTVSTVVDLGQYDTRSVDGDNDDSSPPPSPHPSVVLSPPRVNRSHEYPPSSPNGNNNNNNNRNCNNNNNNNDNTDHGSRAAALRTTMERSTSTAAVTGMTMMADNEMDVSMVPQTGSGAAWMEQHPSTSLKSLSMWKGQQGETSSIGGDGIIHDAETNRGNVVASEGDDDILSQVSSTASEMGTVVNMGEEARAARMAEIDDMAAAMEADEEGNGPDHHKSTRGEGPPGDSQLHTTSLLHEVGGKDDGCGRAPLNTSLFALDNAGLSLPILESRSFDQPMFLPANRRKLNQQREVHLMQQRLHFLQSASFDESLNRGKIPTNDDVNFVQNDAVSASSVSNGHTNVTNAAAKQLKASGFFSAALRRMGNSRSNGTTTSNANTNVSLSAPPTPRTDELVPPSVQDLLRSTLTPNRARGSTKGLSNQSAEARDPPSSFALRSPGSLARFSLQKAHAQREHQHHQEARPVISPRFSSLDPIVAANRTKNGNRNLRAPTRREPHQRSHHTTALAPPSSTKATISPRLAISQTFQIAQKCFSFDTTLGGEYSVDDYYEDDEVGVRRDGLVMPGGGYQQTRGLAPRLQPLEEIPRHSQSWDVGARSVKIENSAQQRVPFRETPSWHRGLSSTPPELGLTLNTGFEDANSDSMPLRGRISSDFSPTKHSSAQAAVELKTPHRIEIEREDALDILACLVERGISDWNPGPLENADGKASSAAVSDIATEKEEKDGEAALPDAFSPSESMVATMTAEIRRLISKNGTPEQSHSQRMAVLDELLRSHAYAIEMKRASVSASTWLKSIGRGDATILCTSWDSGAIKPTSKVKKNYKGTGSSPIIESEGGRQSVKEGKNEVDGNVRSGGQMELLTLKAMLHGSQLELAETKKANKSLNEELSTCRAEIGRLKSLSRNEHVNRSILDDSHDTDESTATGISDAISKEGPVSPIQQSQSDIEEQDRFFDVSKFDASQPSNGDYIDEIPDTDVGIDSANVWALRKALEQANATIRRLHEDARTATTDDKGEEESSDPPVVAIPDFATNEEENERARSPVASPEYRTINVRMLDGENFVTDWDDLRPPLPPPPDHGLHSPIVDAVLEQWTDDVYLHESLMAWMEQVMKGDELEALPPLTISSLDHQVRDGFTMHVLPLLLRRADIHVAVQTRAHRQTTYDMSVTVSQKHLIGSFHGRGVDGTSSQLESQQQPSLLDRQDSSRDNSDQWMEQFEPRLSSTDSVAHSAVTEAIANMPHEPATLKHPQFLSSPKTPLRSPKDEYNSFATQLRMRSASGEYSQDGSIRSSQLSGQGAQNGTGTIMGALGGALSGLLSRSKYAASPGRAPAPVHYLSGAVQSSDPRDSNTMRASLRAELDLTSSPVPTSSNSTYQHRIVSAHSTEEQQMQQQQQHDQPYHRVVSAPPGRIGVTFVEFRGHAMVSDVGAESPLSGWVFPSDVLIAVDEIAVSGMRVRDIVKILSDRKDRHRAMRVISSHDMNDFTSATNTSEIKASGEE